MCKGDKSTSGLLQVCLDPSIMFRIKVLCTCTSRLVVDAERLSFLTQTKWLFVGANLKCNFNYLKARTRSLSPVTWKQPSNVHSFISRRHRWCFTALCWTRADNYKKLQLPLKIPKLALIFPFFFLYKASFVPAQTSLKSLSPGCTCLWGVVLLYRTWAGALAQLLSGSLCSLLTLAHPDSHSSIDWVVFRL